MRIKTPSSNRIGALYDVNAFYKPRSMVLSLLIAICHYTGINTHVAISATVAAAAKSSSGSITMLSASISAFIKANQMTDTSCANA